MGVLFFGVKFSYLNDVWIDRLGRGNVMLPFWEGWLEFQILKNDRYIKIYDWLRKKTLQPQPVHLSRKELYANNKKKAPKYKTKGKKNSKQLHLQNWPPPIGVIVSRINLPARCSSNPSPRGARIRRQSICKQFSMIILARQQDTRQSPPKKGA